ncbi:MAG: M6 family metalloprotease domain-containing protein [Candidatus Marinimicrobia bacterium]|nr:M6 family metalloprotease domain-containing protein [Candidatus Neomarinimicrobiota bacterium]
MLNKIISILLLGLSTLFASTPAKPGVIPSEVLIEQIAIMSETYGQGGLAAKMQGIRAANIQHAENGTRDLREDIYMSFPVIMGSYSDYDDATNVINLLQSELFDGPWPSVTMAEHYEEMSLGQFHLSGTVYGWYELGETGQHYGGTDNGFDGGVGDFLHESLDLSDIEIDFREYDNDGPDGVPNSGDDDGVVDAAFFVHSGPDGAAGGPYIWSHRWSYSAASGTGSAYTTNDTGANGSPITVDDYIMQPAEGSNGGLIEIAVFSHEFGHAIGLPDLYDTDYSSDGIGRWCLMAGGTNLLPNSSPPHMSVWCKEMLGWVIPVVLDANIDSISIPPIVPTGFALKVWKDGEVDPWESGYGQGLEVGREYFLIENRQHIGTDQHLVGTGLIIYHVDNTQWGNSDDEHRLVDIEPANGQEGGTNPGQTWSATSENQLFDFQTIPSSASYAFENTEVAIFNFVENDSSIIASVEVNEAFPHLGLVDFILADANDDGFLSPGESGQLSLTLINYGLLATDVSATIIEDNSAFNFTTAAIGFENILSGTAEVSTAPFEFTMASDFESGTSTLRFQVNNSTSDIIDTLSFDLIIGDPQVAVVDADGAVSGDMDVQDYYTQALIDNDIVYTIWDVALDGLPTEEWLLGRPNVIYFTGSAGLPLTVPVINLLSSYQDGGGRLLLTGQDLTDGDEVQAAFLNEYCAVDFVEEQTVNPRYLFGNPDHGIMTAADQYRINTIYGANNQTSPDVVERLSHGTKLFQYPRLDDQAAGVTTIQNGYKTIFLAFGFEAIAGLEDEGPEVRADLIQRFLEWFKLDYVGIDSENILKDMTPGISHFYPNPFNPTVNIGYVLPERVELTLTVYDIAGREVTQLLSGDQSAGSHEIQWNGVDASGLSVSTGVYFCRLEVGEISHTIKMVYLK